MSQRQLAPKGGKREGAGRKPEWFKERCAELAGSPKFFEFAEKVFDGQNVDPRITKIGVIYVEASVGDKVYLWEKLASYGYGKPMSDIDLGKIAEPLQKIVNQNQALKLIQELNYPNRSGNKNGAEVVMGNGHTSPSSESSAA